MFAPLLVLPNTLSRPHAYHTLIVSLIGTLALAATAAPAAAQQAPQQSQARPDWVTQFDDQTLRYLLADLQATWTVEQGQDGSLTYRASTAGGINFVLAPRSCDAQSGCVGLLLVALFDEVNVSNAAQLDAFVNRFNDTQPTAKVMRNAQGMVALQAYVNVAYGVTYRNVQAQILVFGQNITNLSRALVQFEQTQ